MNQIFRRFLGYTLNGLVITLPVFGTGYIIYQLFVWLDGIVPGIIYSESEMARHEDGFSGLGILMLLILLFLMGWLGTIFLNDQLKGLFEKLLNRIPGVNNLYNTIADLLNAFVGNKRKFNKPVLVKTAEGSNVEVIGFVTDDDLAELGDLDTKGKIAVYVPMSYSFSGHLIIVPKTSVTVVDRNAVEVMKYIVSGGIVEIESNEEHKNV
jgi:uncharacterized membrane protein